MSSLIPIGECVNWYCLFGRYLAASIEVHTSFYLVIRHLAIFWTYLYMYKKVCPRMDITALFVTTNLGI